MTTTLTLDFLLLPVLGVTKLMENSLDATRSMTEKLRTGENPYLQHNFGPVSDEMMNVPLNVLVGKIPNDLRGAFLRNGPNPKHTPKGLYHWFDGDGMIHSVRLRGSHGDATYTNHQIRTRKLKYEDERGFSDWLKVGDMKGPLGLMKMGLFNARSYLGDTRLRSLLSQLPDGVANTSIKLHAGKLMACSEMYYPTTLRLREVSELYNYFCIYSYSS